MSQLSTPILNEHIVERDDLAQVIIDLENGLVSPITDPQLAYDLAKYIKPIVDQLPRVENDSLLGDAPDEIDHSDEQEPSLGSIETESDAAEMEDRAARRKRATRKAPRLDGPAPELEQLSSQDKARWILMERFIPLEKHEEILGCKFSNENFERYLQDLDTFLEKLFLLPNVAKALEACDLPALQKIFASTLLIFRHPIVGEDAGDPLPCSIENLRHCFPDYFYKRRKAPNWYESYPFYTSTFAYAHWALCDLDYLNCTLRQPQRRLQNYARQWLLPDESVVQKTVLDDIYDRIICGEALEEHLFEQNCNACTSTRYQKRKGPLHLVYTVQKDQKIAIHGKVGIPHWRATRRLWPGAYPAIVP
jgi:hypothetical protein